MTASDPRSQSPTVIVATTLAATHGPAMRLQAGIIAERGARLVGVGHGLDRAAASQDYAAAYDLPLPRPTAPLSLARSVLRFRRICRTERPDLVWLHTSLAAAVGRVAMLTLPRRHRPTVVYLAYGFYFDSVNRSMAAHVFRGIEWLLSLVTDHLQTVSREDYERARRLPGRTPGNTELTRGLGIDLDHLRTVAEHRDEARKRLGLGDGDRAVFVAGKLVRKNRTIDALEAVSALGDGTRLFVLGDGPELRSLETAASGLPGPAPVFLGDHADRVHLLCAADALIHPSSTEGLPSMVLEAQAMDIPVVGARVRGSTDLLSGSAGILVTHRNVPAMTAGLRTVLTDGPRREAIIAAGATRAWQHQSDFAIVAARNVSLLLDRRAGAADDAATGAAVRLGA